MGAEGGLCFLPPVRGHLAIWRHFDGHHGKVVGLLGTYWVEARAAANIPQCTAKDYPAPDVNSATVQYGAT